MFPLHSLVQFVNFTVGARPILFSSHTRYAFTVISNVVIYVVAWAYFGVEAGAEADPSKAQIGPEDADAFTVRN